VRVVVVEDDLKILLGLHWDRMVNYVCIPILDWLHLAVLVITTCKKKVVLRKELERVTVWARRPHVITCMIRLFLSTTWNNIWVSNSELDA
jgi:hypothetical protein